MNCLKPRKLRNKLYKLHCVYCWSNEFYKERKCGQLGKEEILKKIKDMNNI